MADIVANAGGERTTVLAIMPPHADPHTDEPMPGEVVEAATCLTLIAIGPRHKSFINRGTWRLAIAGRATSELHLADHVTLLVVDEVIDHDDHIHDLRAGDPHIWLDPNKVIEMLPPIADHLGALDPAGRPVYKANVARHREALAALDREIEAGLASIPRERRKLVVFHDAYRYFAARYDFEVIGIVLASSVAQLSAQEIAALNEIIRTTGVPAIFKEPRFASTVIDRLAADTGVRVGELLTDNLAGRVITYIELMRFNMRSLVDHLGPS